MPFAVKLAQSQNARISFKLHKKVLGKRQIMTSLLSSLLITVQFYCRALQGF